ncbi:MAG TPA: hypothetical protein VMD50_07640 [Mycobacterium sp.]|nr:hypothetical protein [Mycobacterium sp.]
MTGRLYLRLDKYLMSDSVDHAAVATIRALTPVSSVGKSSNTREVVIPSGASPPLAVDLDPGRYLVEASLPSGDLVSDEVEIADNKDSTLELRADESPHEWLSWQQFMGNVERIEQYSPTEGPFAWLEPDVHWVADPAPPLRGDEPLGGEYAWRLLPLLSGLHGEAVQQLSIQPPLSMIPFQSDGQATLYQATGDGPWHLWQLPTSPGGPPTPRRYLIVEVAGAIHLVCIPVPWTDLTTRNQVPVQILVRKRTAAEDPAITVTIRDRLIGSALGYMTQGALPTAERLFDPARVMLFEKLSNPLGAAGGGYVLLGTERSSEKKEWHLWIHNLMKWFEWLPDGAIQHGWLKLRHRETSKDLDEARDALFTAYRRGLPFYSVGLQWLIDGLTLFAPHDRDAATMLENVHRVAWRTNLQEPFTIVRLPLA